MSAARKIEAVPPPITTPDEMRAHLELGKVIAERIEEIGDPDENAVAVICWNMRDLHEAWLTGTLDWNTEFMPYGRLVSEIRKWGPLLVDWFRAQHKLAGSIAEDLDAWIAAHPVEPPPLDAEAEAAAAAIREKREEEARQVALDEERQRQEKQAKAPKKLDPWGETGRQDQEDMNPACYLYMAMGPALILSGKWSRHPAAPELAEAITARGFRPTPMGDLLSLAWSRAKGAPVAPEVLPRLLDAASSEDGYHEAMRPAQKAISRVLDEGPDALSDLAWQNLNPPAVA